MTIFITNPPGFGTPSQLIHEFEWEPRYNHIPTTDGEAVVQHLGFVRKKTVVIFWANDPATAEGLIRAQETGGYARSGEVQWEFPAGDMVGLYIARSTLIKFSATGS